MEIISDLEKNSLEEKERGDKTSLQETWLWTEGERVEATYVRTSRKCDAEATGGNKLAYEVGLYGTPLSCPFKSWLHVLPQPLPR